MSTSLEIDHLVVCADTLEEGADYIHETLGVPVVPGGKHPLMGTHNLLLSLGPDHYLEVIAIDPDAPAPDRPRWLNLDLRSGPPCLTHVILRCDNLTEAMASAPKGLGQETALERGDFRWRMAVPESGRLPYDDIAPTLISWEGQMPPAHLPDQGVRIGNLTMTHPDMDGLCADYPALVGVDLLSLSRGKTGLRAEIETENGTKILS